MKIRRKTVGGVAVVTFTGELDGPNLPAFRAELNALSGQARARVVINLEKVRFLNSSALAHLLATAKRVRDLHGELVLAEPSPFFRATIATLGMDRVFDVFATEGEAIDHLRRGEGEDGAGTPAWLLPHDPTGSAGVRPEDADDARA